MHQEGKWEAVEYSRHWAIQIDGKNHFLSNDYANAEANARRICQCVNSHDALLEACKAVIDNYSPVQRYGEVPEFVEKCEQAIAKAEGK